MHAAECLWLGGVIRRRFIISLARHRKSFMDSVYWHRGVQGAEILQPADLPAHLPFYAIHSGFCSSFSIGASALISCLLTV